METTGNGWMTTSKPTFQIELLALPAKEVKQVLEKITLLLDDPSPDGHTRKLLKYVGGHQVCRLRSGNYRIFYTYRRPYISLLALRRRDDDTYAADITPEHLGGLDPKLPDLLDADKDDQPVATQPVAGRAPEAAHAPRAAPVPITVELLRNLRVPARYHQQLLTVTNQDELLACAGVPDEHLLYLDAYLFERPLEEVLQQPDYLTPVEDLQRYKDGDLLGFLLLLSPEQERYVTWAINAAGPTLVKGGPGTGKSTIALYRVRAMLEALRKAGIGRPRILFTTYTKALVAYSEQLLASLLGEDAACVDVRNVDKLVMEVGGPVLRGWNIAQQEDCRQALDAARRAVQFEGNALQRAAQRETVEELSRSYLLEEFDGVIEARALLTLDEYLATARTGRLLRLNAIQRRAVWQLYGEYTSALARRKLLAWGAARRRAAVVARGIAPQKQYDAVVIDEAQDLDPNQIRLLVSLCRAPNRLFFTADANQSIYGSQFRWREVHEWLHFRGRTGILTTNYRTTREIGLAAHRYLGTGELDEEGLEQTYRTRGVRPEVRALSSHDEETAVLADFFRRSLASVRLGIGACAVLVPSERAGQSVAARLTASGLPAFHMPGDRLDLRKQCVKVLTLKSAKGLEFPVVALAGFLDGPYPFLSPRASDEERQEALARERRTIFVGMTRAMRALLVTRPARGASPLLQPFMDVWWDGDPDEELPL